MQESSKMSNVLPCDTLEDVPGILTQHIKENLAIQKRLVMNDGKFEKLLQAVQEMKCQSTDSTAVDTPKVFREEDLLEIENQIRETSAEHSALKKSLNNSTSLLQSLATRVEGLDQYIKRENLFFDFKNVSIPYHLKGYKFSRWLAKTITNLIPSLDFPILPSHISVSHPMSPKSSVVIARFAIRDVRNEIFFKKHKIIDARVKVSEHLTSQNQLLLDTAQHHLGPSNAWSSQTKLYGKVGGETIQIKSMDDVDLLRGMKCSLEMPSLPEDDANHAMNLNPRFDLEEIESNWPHLSQHQILIAIDNFVSRRGKTKHHSKRKSKGSLTKTRKKHYLVPPPIHHSYSN